MFRTPHVLEAEHGASLLPPCLFNGFHHDINIHVPAGSSLAIVGPTGAGKSSLVNLLARVYDVTSGSVEIDGHDVRAIPLVELRRSLGYVPQENFLFSLSIRENVGFGAPNLTEEQMLEARDVRAADPFLPLAVQDVHEVELRREPVGDLARSIGRVVVDHEDANVLVGERAHHLLEVLALVVGRQTDRRVHAVRGYI